MNRYKIDYKKVKDLILYKYYDNRLNYIFGDIDSKLEYVNNLKKLKEEYTKIITYDKVDFYFTDHFIVRYNERSIRSDIYHVIVDVIDIYELLKVKYNDINNIPRRIRLGLRDYMYVLDIKNNGIKVVSSYELDNIGYVYYIHENITKINFDSIADIVSLIDHGYDMLDMTLLSVYNRLIFYTGTGLKNKN